MGGMGLMEHLWYVYGPLEGRTARCTVRSTDRKLSDNQHRQITPDYRRLPMLWYRWKTVEKLRWNLVDSRDLPNSAIFCHSGQIDQSQFSIPRIENRHWFA